MEPTDLERQLIHRCLNGDEQAQFQLYRRYATAMYNTAVRILSNTADAEDVLQMAFSKVFQQLHTFRHEATIGSWIKRIVVNTALNTLKNRQKLQFVELDPAFVEPVADHEPPYEKFDAAMLHAAIKELPDGARVVFTLYAVEEMSHQSIAQQLGITESTSKTQYRRAKQLLKTRLAAWSEAAGL